MSGVPSAYQFRQARLAASVHAGRRIGYNNSNDIEAPAPELTVGLLRFQTDRRQLGGLILSLAICVTFQPLVNVASNVDPSGSLSNDSSAVSLAAGLVQVIVGLLGMLAGQLALVYDQGNKYLTATICLITQFAWFPFLYDLQRIFKVIADADVKNNPFIPAVYFPEQQDIRFVGVCGLMGAIAYGVSLLGSLAFAEFALLAFDNGRPQARNSLYYRGRLSWYSFLIIFAGLSQIMIGAYVRGAFGGGSLQYGAIVVRMYVINIPEINIAVGALQTIVGTFGLCRSFGIVDAGRLDHRFQTLLALQWLAMFGLQNVAQVAYSSGSLDAATSPVIACLSFGMNALPAFLDYKMRQLPDTIPETYYEIPPDSTPDNRWTQGIKQNESVNNTLNRIR
jgi:hypothetical protein